MILIANGCSHTAGAEIEHELQGACHEKAWPKLLADRLNFDHLNLSFSGASCERVVRTSIEKLHHLRQKTSFDPSQIFFVVMWPDIWRKELYEVEKNEAGFFDNGWTMLCANNDEIYKKHLSKNAYYYYKAWMLRVNNYQESVRWYNNILQLQNILVSHKIKYVFYQASQSLPLTILPQYTELVNHKRFPTIHHKKFNYCTLLESEGFEHGPKSVWGHYGEDAQEWFAEYLYDIIKENKLL